MPAVKIALAMSVGLLLMSGCASTTFSPTLDSKTNVQLNSKSAEVWTNFAQ